MDTTEEIIDLLDSDEETTDVGQQLDKEPNREYEPGEITEEDNIFSSVVPGEFNTLRDPRISTQNQPHLIKNRFDGNKDEKPFITSTSYEKNVETVQTKVREADKSPVMSEIEKKVKEFSEFKKSVRSKRKIVDKPVRSGDVKNLPVRKSSSKNIGLREQRMFSNVSSSVIKKILNIKEDEKSVEMLDPDVQEELDAAVHSGLDDFLIQSKTIKRNLDDKTKLIGFIKSDFAKSEKTEEVDMTMSNTNSSLRKMLHTIALTPKEKFKVLDARDKLLKLNQNKEQNVCSKLFVGVCPDMCPEKERYMREYQSQVSMFEMNNFPHDRTMRQEAAVKEYARSSADQEEPLPHELRPVGVLNMTMSYLLHNIVDNCEVSDEYLAEWYFFMWDRTRAVRKELTQQGVSNINTVKLVEECARFHIHCAERMIEQETSVYDDKINTENLTKCLQTLKYMYTDLRRENVVCHNQPEFVAYSILLNLNNSSFIMELRDLPEDVLKSDEISFALRVMSCWETRNYVRFFNLVKRTSYLNCCLLRRYFHEMRLYGTTALAQAYYTKTRVPKIDVMSFMDKFIYETIDECVQFYESCHFDVELANEQFYVCLDRNSYVDPELPPPTRCFIYIEKKKTTPLSLVMCKNELPERTFEGHSVQNSFTEQGELKVEAMLSLDVPETQKTTTAAAELVSSTTTITTTATAGNRTTSLFSSDSVVSSQASSSVFSRLSSEPKVDLWKLPEQQQQQSQQTSSSWFTPGSTNTFTSQSMFSNKTATTAGSHNLFSNKTATTFGSGNLFSNKTATTAGPDNLFSNKTATTFGSGNLFSNKTATTVGSGNLFSNKTATAFGSGNLFSNKTATTAGSGNLFSYENTPNIFSSSTGLFPPSTTSKPNLWNTTPSAVNQLFSQPSADIFTNQQELQSLEDRRKKDEEEVRRKRREEMELREKEMEEVERRLEEERRRMEEVRRRIVEDGKRRLEDERRRKEEDRRRMVEEAKRRLEEERRRKEEEEKRRTEEEVKERERLRRMREEAAAAEARRLEEERKLAEAKRLMEEKTRMEMEYKNKVDKKVRELKEKWIIWKSKCFFDKWRRLTWNKVEERKVRKLFETFYLKHPRVCSDSLLDGNPLGLIIPTTLVLQNYHRQGELQEPDVRTGTRPEVAQQPPPLPILSVSKLAGKCLEKRVRDLYWRTDSKFLNFFPLKLVISTPDQSESGNVTNDVDRLVEMCFVQSYDWKFGQECKPLQSESGCVGTFQYTVCVRKVRGKDMHEGPVANSTALVGCNSLVFVIVVNEATDFQQTRDRLHKMLMTKPLRPQIPVTFLVFGDGIVDSPLALDLEDLEDFVSCHKIVRHDPTHTFVDTLKTCVVTSVETCSRVPCARVTPIKTLVTDVVQTLVWNRLRTLLSDFKIVLWEPKQIIKFYNECLNRVTEVLTDAENNSESEVAEEFVDVIHELELLPRHTATRRPLVNKSYVRDVKTCMEKFYLPHWPSELPKSCHNLNYRIHQYCKKITGEDVAARKKLKWSLYQVIRERLLSRGLDIYCDEDINSVLVHFPWVDVFQLFSLCKVNQADGVDHDGVELNVLYQSDKLEHACYEQSLVPSLLVKTNSKKAADVSRIAEEMEHRDKHDDEPSVADDSVIYKLSEEVEKQAERQKRKRKQSVSEFLSDFFYSQKKLLLEQETCKKNDDISDKLTQIEIKLDLLEKKINENKQFLVTEE